MQTQTIREMHGAALRRFFRNIYRDAPALLRWLSMWRPSISPFETIVAQVPSDAQSLDVGCGTGALLLYLAGSGRIVSGEGYDISTQAIACANNAREKLPGATLLFANIRSFDDLPDKQFDAVLMVDVLHHVPAVPARSRHRRRRGAGRAGRPIYLQGYRLAAALAALG